MNTLSFVWLGLFLSSYLCSDLANALFVYTAYRYSIFFCSKSDPFRGLKFYWMTESKRKYEIFAVLLYLVSDSFNFKFFLICLTYSDDSVTYESGSGTQYRRSNF